MECSICLDIIQTDKKGTRCGHIFHRTCLELWMDKNTTCPICREELVNRYFDYIDFELLLYLLID